MMLMRWRKQVWWQPWLLETWQHECCHEFSSFCSFFLGVGVAVLGGGGEKAEEGGDSLRDDPANNPAGAQPVHSSRRNSALPGLNP